MSVQAGLSSETDAPLSFVLSGHDQGLSGFLSKHPEIELSSSDQSLPEAPYIHAFIINQENFAQSAFWLSHLPEDDPILCQKILVLNGNIKPDRKMLSFFNEFGTERIFSGQKRGLQIKTFIDQAINDKELVGSAYYYRYELFKSLKENNHQKAISLLKNFWISFEGTSTNKIATSVYLQMNETKKAIQHLRGILKETPNMLWAAWELLKLYQQKMLNHEALILAERLGAYNMLNMKRMKIHTHLLFNQYYFNECLTLCNELAQELSSEEITYFKDMSQKCEKAVSTYQTWLDKFQKEYDEDVFCPPELKEVSVAQITLEGVQLDDPSDDKKETDTVNMQTEELKNPAEDEDSDEIEIEVE